ncbi:CKLF-like MARVEL transmembrane domain-containing protein 2 isoform X1 [Nycticebus coucang]|uniref:CKLF-like MARVEL transmembrane domain-containing protein 2 isoform X1 n=1 Tax=Nycticebus coucang TaxID=9470 RepID=UPI00234DB485|nr:CKLF-like MARVEL transmembrane domain-containing protein 2 isoform X1 [Nycticebus coucang]
MAPKAKGGDKGKKGKDAAKAPKQKDKGKKKEKPVKAKAPPPAPEPKPEEPKPEEPKPEEPKPEEVKPAEVKPEEVKPAEVKPAEPKPEEPKPAEAKPAEAKKVEFQEPVREKSVQPKDRVGTRKGFRRYRWELKDSNKEFWSMGHAEVKILSLGCLIATAMLFYVLPVHPVLRLVNKMEIAIFSSFIILYSFAINRYIPFILWPISDLLNDLFSFIFLSGAAVFGFTIQRSLPLYYTIGLGLMGAAAFFALIDIPIQTKHFKGKRARRNALIPPPPREIQPEEPKEAEAGQAPPTPEAAAAPDADPAKGNKK